MIDLEKGNNSGGSKGFPVALVIIAVAVIMVLLAIVPGRHSGVANNIEKQDVSEEVEEEKPQHPADSGRDSLVNLSFAGIQLGQSLRSFASQKGILQQLTEDNFSSGTLSTLTFQHKLVLSGKKYPVETSVIVVDDKVARITGMIYQDINEILSPVFSEKYGDKTYNGWRFRNQSIIYEYNKPQRVIWHPELKKYIYTHYYDFKDITIIYEDYSLCDKLEVIQTEKNELFWKEKALKDSLEREEKIKQERIEAEQTRKRLETEGEQI